MSNKLKLTKAAKILIPTFKHCNLFQQASKHLTHCFKNSPTLGISRSIVDTHSTTFATHQPIDVKNTKTLVINSPILDKHSPVFVKNTLVFVKNSPISGTNAIALGNSLNTIYSFPILFLLTSYYPIAVTMVWAVAQINFYG